MPFPLAHPAAVLPLRRYCLKHLSLAALVAGSLCPDLGYFLFVRNLGRLSHSFIAGTFEFCLPAGALILVMFYTLRTWVATLLPGRYQEALLPLCRTRLGSPFFILLSLLIGIWSHLFLDCVTHFDGWIGQRLPAYFIPLPTGGKYFFKTCEWLYSVCTLAGISWLSLSYLRWLATISKQPKRVSPWFKYVFAFVFALSILWVAQSGRGYHAPLGLSTAGILTGVLAMAFLIIADRVWR